MNILKFVLSGLLGLMCFAFANPALAGPPKVYSPIVEKGELEIEHRGIIEDEDGVSDKKEYVFEVGYGFTDRFFSSLYTELKNVAGSSTKVESLSWENIIQLTEQGQYFVDVGLYLEYEIGLQSGEPDKFEGKILLEKNIGKFVHTANFIFEKGIGKTAGDGTEFGYAWQSRYLLNPKFELGIQAFGNFGEIGDFPSISNTEHLLGPAAFGKFRLGKKSFLAYEAGYLIGLTSGSPDNAFRWLVEYEIYF